jgi:hypothetical protein
MIRGLPSSFNEPLGERAPLKISEGFHEIRTKEGKHLLSCRPWPLMVKKLKSALK